MSDRHLDRAILFTFAPLAALLWAGFIVQSLTL